jgi:hypothetical protein
LYDNGNHFTHFTGWMLEEEIAASLQWFNFDYTKNYF